VVSGGLAGGGAFQPFDSSLRHGGNSQKSARYPVYHVKFCVRPSRISAFGLLTAPCAMAEVLKWQL